MRVSVETSGGTGLLASVALAASAGVIEAVVAGDKTQPVTVLLAFAAVGFIAGMFGVRARATGVGLPVSLLTASALAVAAAVVGTTMSVSGVVLTVPVVVIGALSIIRGGWRLGDTGIFILLVGLGMAAGYLIAAALDPDTGSFADQGAVALVVLGAGACSVAVARLAALSAVVRSALVVPPALAVIAALAGPGLGASAFALGLLGTLWGCAWTWIGLSLIRCPPDPSLAQP
jgi:hypothetical protein